MASRNEVHQVSRRRFLQWSALGTSAALMAACAAPGAAPTGGTAESSEVAPAAGTVDVVVWYQDWDGANRIMNAAKEARSQSNPDVNIDLQPIGYSDLFAKLLPAIAAGTEGDVMMMYTDWIVATDVSKVFLELTDLAGGASALEEAMWPAAFGALDAPGGKVFYLPWLAGIRGAALTVNTEQLAAKNIDYLNFASFEDVIEAGKALTEKTADGKISLSGYSPRSSQYPLLWSFIWQMGGEFFDRETGKWSHNSEIGMQAAQLIYDIYWSDQTCDFELFTSEYEAVSQKLVSMWGDGAWTASVQTDSAEIPADNIVTPRLANKVNDVLYPQHIAGWGISKRLVDDSSKLQPAFEFSQYLVSPDSTIQAFDSYSGVCMTKAVYEDPRIEDVKFGPMSKRIATGMWPIAKFSGDHVANHGPASTEFERALRQEITLEEALANMDAYLQEQEDQARERING
ncbi:MAG: extracellular solute-binding protein [Caldilineaceae bacterium]|nr:extracellular solute-binding protein [Caldilineaceae bacterium]